MADAKSVWSWRKIVESSAEFLCRACVRVGNDVIEWFPVNVGLRQGCVMSPWLFNVYMDGVVREVNVRVLGKRLELLSANGGRFEINQQLFADDTALVADSEYIYPDNWLIYPLRGPPAGKHENVIFCC